MSACIFFKGEGGGIRYCPLHFNFPSQISAAHKCILRKGPLLSQGVLPLSILTLQFLTIWGGGGGTWYTNSSTKPASYGQHLMSTHAYCTKGPSISLRLVMKVMYKQGGKNSEASESVDLNEHVVIRML